MGKTEINLFIAMGVFLKEVRGVFHSMLLTEYGEKWNEKYSETFNPEKKREWNNQISNGELPKNLIDFGNLVIFSEAHRNSRFFKRKFPRFNRSIATYFKDIVDTRNKLMHFLILDTIMVETAFNHMIKISNILNLDDLVKELEILKKEEESLDEAEKAYLHMKDIAKKLDMDELENDIRQLKNDSFKELNTAKESSISTTNDKRNKPETSKRPKLSQVINVIYNTEGFKVDQSNTNLSTINSTRLYSVEPNFKRKENDWYLLLINTEQKTIYVFKIPSNDNVYGNLDQRVNKQVYRLTFDVDDLTFRDKSSEQKFDTYLEVVCQYDDDSLIFS